MNKKESKSFHPKSRNAWRKWLEKNHDSEQSVWLIHTKMKEGKRTLTWSDSVDEALCFGWIDSIAKPIDEHTYKQFFSKRKPSSTWSKINKIKVKKLIEDGLMSEAGLKTIEIAKHNGTWSILDEVEELVIPKDLLKAFKAHAGSKAYFLSLSKSVRKMMLQWIVLAKRDETRQKRIQEIAELAALKQKPKQLFPESPKHPS